MTPVFIRLVERLRVVYGDKLDEWLVEDAPAAQSRYRDQEHDTMLAGLNDLVPDSVSVKLRGTLLEAGKKQAGRD